MVVDSQCVDGKIKTVKVVAGKETVVEENCVPSSVVVAPECIDGKIKTVQVVDGKEITLEKDCVP